MGTHECVWPFISKDAACAAAAAAGKTLDRDFYMSPADARGWGLVDSVIEHRPLETAVSS